MTVFNDNKGLFNPDRFRAFEKEKTKRMRSLTLQECSDIFENLTSGEILAGMADKREKDAPLCLKLSLLRKKDETAI